MIDKKKIEEAAKLYAWNNRSDEGGEEDMLDKKRAFRLGINWFLDGLWHDASEDPKEAGAQILLELEFYGKRQYQVYIYSDLPFYSDIVDNYNVVRWLYIDDLLKGGTHD